MPMVPSKLADEIASAVKADSPTPQIIGMATAFVSSVLAATFSHPVINGVTAPGAPLSAGAAPGGLILGIVGPKISSDIASAVGGPPTPQILALGTGFQTVMLAALVNFNPGGITGQCTNTPTSPGPLAGGGGQKGQITGLVPDALAAQWAPAFGGMSPELQGMAKAVVEFFSNEAEAQYPPGTVNGVCPPAGGPLVGLGAGGIFL